MDDVKPKNGNGTHDDPVVVEVKGNNNLTGGQLAKLVVLGVVIAVLIPVSVTIYIVSLNNDETQRLARQNIELTKANADLIKRVDEQRVKGDQRAFEECIAAEARDAIYVDWGSNLLRVARNFSQSDQEIQMLITSLEDGIQDLEPEDEEECKQPTGVTP